MATTHKIIDSTGTSVIVPTAITRVADAWPAHNEVVQMLGAGDEIVATVLTSASVPWLYTIDPNLDKAQTVFTNTTANTENLIQTRPDVLFTDKGTPIAAKTTELGVPTVGWAFRPMRISRRSWPPPPTFSDRPPRPKRRNTSPNLDGKLAAVSSVTSKIPVAQRPSVLHIYSLNPLVVDGTDSIIDAWITAAGGRNAAQVKGNARPVSTEQVVQWNPDVIILASSAFTAADTGPQTVAKLTADPVFSQLAAVRQHRVYVNPTGGWHLGPLRHRRSPAGPGGREGFAP